MTTDLIKAEVWLLGKCDLCGTPLDRIEREGTTVWHFHVAPTESDWETDPDVLTWDHREQPDFDKLGVLLARHGVTVAEIGTQSDQYAVRFGTAVPGPTAAANPDALARECWRLLAEVDKARADRDRADRQIRVHLDIARAAERDRDGARDVAADAIDDLDRLRAEAAERESQHKGALDVMWETVLMADAETAGLRTRLDAVLKVIDLRDSGWVRLSERHPEYFQEVTPGERARRDGWRQGVSMLTDRIRYALGVEDDDPSATAPETPRPPAEAWREFKRVLDEEEPDDILGAALAIPGLWADEEPVPSTEEDTDER